MADRETYRRGARNAAADSLVAFAFALLACSCGGGNGSVNAFAARYCAELTSCCQNAGRPSDDAACRRFIINSTPGIPVAEPEIEACISGLHATVAAPDGCGRAVIDVTRSLNSVFPIPCYATPPGGACRQDSDCAASNEGPVTCATNFLAGDPPFMKCQVHLVGKLGDTLCSGLDFPARNYVCNASNDLYCDLLTDQCSEQLPIGAACVDPSACGAASYCDSANHVCMPRAPHGGACPPTCVSTDYCDSSTNTCATKLALGATCVIVEMCESAQCLGNPPRCTDPDFNDPTFALLQLCGK